MSTPSDIFVDAFKRSASAVNIDLESTDSKTLVEEFESKLSNNADDLKGAAIMARSYSGFSQLFQASTLWGDTFSDRAAAVLANGIFAQMVFSIVDPVNVSRKHHWAPVCFTRRFRKSGGPKIRRGTPISSYDPRLGRVVDVAQADLILKKLKGRPGYNSQDLENFYGVIETSYSRVMANEIQDRELAEFTLGLFALIQNLRMSRADQAPPSDSSDFAKKALELLDMELLPTVHRFRDPVGFSAENYFRAFKTSGWTLYTAPVSRRVAVVFAHSAINSQLRKAAAENLKRRQDAGANIDKSLIIGTPSYTDEELNAIQRIDDCKIVD